MEEGPTTVKAKLSSSLKVLNSPSPRPTLRTNSQNIPSRPVSPTKPSVTANSTVASSPAFRPKAKVNSSATTRKVAVVKASTSTSSTPRSRSPTKIASRIRNGVTSPTHTPKAPSYGSSSTLRSPTTTTAPVTPERTNSLTTASIAASSIAPPHDASDFRLHHAVSFSSLQPTPIYSTPNKPGTVSATSSPRLIPLNGLDREMTSSPTPMARIRSKVSAVAKVADSTGSPTSALSLSPAHPPTRSLSLRTRTASISSTLSQQQSQPTSPPPQFYPITTATSAANPHRYASTRPPSRAIFPAASQVFQSNASKAVSPAGDGSPPSQNRYGVKIDNIQAKVDSSSISAAPLSPPVSTASFSSHSSLSRSSASVSAVNEHSGSQSTSTASSHLSPSGNGKVDLRTTLDNLIEYTSGLPSAESAGDMEDEVEVEEHTVKAAAKSNRKIADLEITNRSLLAINATLETTKHRQAREIRELKRKLRESRLILPPRAYRAVKSSLDPSEIADDEEDAEDEEEGGDEERDERDEVYQRVRVLIDNLLESGKRALEKQVKDFPEGGKGGAKVLTAEEVWDWHQGTGNGNDHDHDNVHEELPSVLESRDDNKSMDAEGDRSFTESEAEVEAMTLLHISSSPPPIFITKPSKSFLLHS